MIPVGGTLRRPPPATRYMIQLGELETVGNLWLDYAVSWVGFIDIHTLPCDTAACIESWNKQQDALFFPARITAWDMGVLWEKNTNV